MEATTEQLRVVVVGAKGFIGKRHCEHVRNSARTELVAVVDSTPKANKTSQMSSVPLYENIEDLLKHHRPDAAIICTPNHTHVPLAVQLARAGVHILCEKPISTTPTDALHLIKEAQEHHVKLLIGHHRRFNPYVGVMKAVIIAGRLGDITAVNGLWTTSKPPTYFEGDTSSWRSERHHGGGVILINLIHDVDILQYLFGPIIRVHAEKTVSRRTRRLDAVEEGAAVMLRFQSGLVGTFILSDHVSSPYSFEQGTGENPDLASSRQDVYRVFGTKGTLSFPDMKLWTYTSTTPSWTVPMTCELIEVPEANVAPLADQLEHFVDVCSGRLPPLCTGEDALRALVVCEAIRSAVNRPEGFGTVDIQIPA